MAYPIPNLSEDNAAAVLGGLYLNMTRLRPGAPPPRLLLTLPPAWGNKYQILLYGGAARHGWAVAGAVTPDILAHVDWPGEIVLHTHWFAALFQGAANPAEAARRLETVQAQIDAFRARTGARVIWTAHNVMPHGNDHPEAFLALRQWIFETFDALHVLEEAHVPILEAAFDRTAPPHFTVPHMLYTGTLPTGVDRATARARFGLPEEALVLGYFGSIQAYKRISMLIDALDGWTGGPAHALIGGLPTDSVAVREVQARIGTRPDVTLLARKIEDHEVQYLHAASDAMVLPYADTLNSGAALMAATFGVPFVMPEGPACSALGPLGAIPFDDRVPGDLLRALGTLPKARRPDPKALAARAPDVISDAFFEALNRL